jgi:hypothetical protein
MGWIPRIPDAAVLLARRPERGGVGEAELRGHGAQRHAAKLQRGGGQGRRGGGLLEVVADAEEGGDPPLCRRRRRVGRGQLAGQRLHDQVAGDVHLGGLVGLQVTAQGKEKKKRKA